MTKYLSEEDFEFRRLVAELEGHQVAIAFCLQITASAVSHRLHTQKHGAWWRAFKKRRSKQRKAERQRRYRARLKQRQLSNQWTPFIKDRGS